MNRLIRMWIGMVLDSHSSLVSCKANNATCRQYVSGIDVNISYGINDWDMISHIYSMQYKQWARQVRQITLTKSNQNWKIHSLSSTAPASHNARESQSNLNMKATTSNTYISILHKNIKTLITLLLEMTLYHPPNMIHIPSIFHSQNTAHWPVHWILTSMVNQNKQLV